MDCLKSQLIAITIADYFAIHIGVINNRTVLCDPTKCYIMRMTIFVLFTNRDDCKIGVNFQKETHPMRTYNSRDVLLSTGCSEVQRQHL